MMMLRGTANNNTNAHLACIRRLVAEAIMKMSQKKKNTWMTSLAEDFFFFTPDAFDWDKMPHYVIGRVGYAFGCITLRHSVARCKYYVTCYGVLYAHGCHCQVCTFVHTNARYASCIYLDCAYMCCNTITMYTVC